MKQLILLALATLSLTANAQKSPIKFGDIPMEDMKMTVYQQDSSASAVILADYAEAFVLVSATQVSLKVERHRRIKILKKDGLEWADAEIRLYHAGDNEERIIGLKGTTYNLENGKIVETKFDKSNIFKEKIDRYYNRQKFTFPNAKEGSVLEYSYTLSSDFITNFPNWRFQHTIPVRHSEYWAIIPEFFQMEKYMSGYLPVTSYEVKNKQQPSYNDIGHHWILKNVPAFKEEPFMTSEEDYVSRINFALASVTFPGQPIREFMSSWKSLNDDLLQDDNFGKVVSGSNYLGKTVDDLIAGETDEMKKIEKIYNFVRTNIEWDGDQDYYALKPREVFEKKKGSSGDINLLLGSMLEKAGLPVDMILLSTRDHGFIREQYPMRRQFNYVIAAPRVNGKPVFLDATDRYIPMGVLPERCLNGQGLIISKNFHGWIPLETKTKERLTVSADLSLSETNELKGKITFSHDGYNGANTRKDFKSRGEQGYIKSFLANKPNWQFEKSTFENLDDIGKAFKDAHEVLISEHITENGDILYINPFVTEQMQKNPFKLKDRVYPVNYGSPKETIYMAKFILPEGFLVDELPKNQIMSLPGGLAKYTYSCTQVGNTINVMSNFQINRNIFVQTEYANLREFYNQVVAKQAEQIVLKKKT